MNGPPNLRALTAFPIRHGTVNIPQEIGVKYQVFGAQLLDDPTGAKVNNMEHKHIGDSLRINTEVLQEWLRGQGRRPDQCCKVARVSSVHLQRSFQYKTG